MAHSRCSRDICYYLNEWSPEIHCIVMASQNPPDQRFPEPSNMPYEGCSGSLLITLGPSLLRTAPSHPRGWVPGPCLYCSTLPPKESMDSKDTWVKVVQFQSSQNLRLGIKRHEKSERETASLRKACLQGLCSWLLPGNVNFRNGLTYP